MKKIFIILMVCILTMMNLPVEAMAVSQTDQIVAEDESEEQDVEEPDGVEQSCEDEESDGLDEEDEAVDESDEEDEKTDESDEEDETDVLEEESGNLTDEHAGEEAESAAEQFVVEDSITGVNGDIFVIASPNPVALNEVNAATFGLDPDIDDNYDAFNAALKYCKSNPNTYLEINRGVYHFRTEKDLTLEKCQNILIDGNGSEFVFSTPKYFKINQCNGIEFRELAIEWDWESSRLASLVRIHKFNKPAKTFEIEFMELDEVDVDIPIICFMQYAKDTLTPGSYGGYKTFYPGQVPNGIVKREKVAPNRIKIYCGEEKYLDTFHDEEVFLIRHYTYGGRVFQPSRSENITFDDIHIYSAAGMGYIIGDKTKYFQIINSSIGRRTDRVDAPYISTTADGMHILNTSGYFRIENNDFSFTGDDIMNIHDDVMTITKRVSDTVFIGKVTGGFAGTGDKVKFKNTQMGTFEGLEDYEVEVESFNRDASTNIATITLKTPVNSAIGDEGFIYRSSTSTSNYVIRNNYIHETKGRAMLILGSNALVENNIIYRTVSEGIHVLADVDSKGVGSGGYGSSNVVIRNNTLTECTVGDKEPVIMVRYKKDKEISEYNNVLTNIVIENNKFIGCYVDAIEADNVTNLTIKDNIIQDCGKRDNDGVYCENIILKEHCANVINTGNTITFSTHVDTHDVIEIQGRAASCVSYGMKPIKYCNDCHRKISGVQAIKPIAHNSDTKVILNNVDATCTEDGSYDENYYCSMCDMFMSTTHKTVEATGHSFNKGICTRCSYRCTHTKDGAETIEDNRCVQCGKDITALGEDVDDLDDEDVPEQLWISGIRNYEYTGKKIEQPSVKVFWNRKKLTLGSDYTVKYLNNIKAGKATVVITGRGNYSGTIRQDFVITPVDIKAAVPADGDITLLANGKLQKPVTKFTVERNGKKVILKSNVDYKYEYPEIKEPGDYFVTVRGYGNYAGTRTINVHVVKDAVPVSKLVVKKIPDQSYTGGKIEPEIQVSYNKKVLTPGTDYTVSYGSNTAVGTGIVTLKGNGTEYIGQRNISFNIAGVPITKAVVNGLQVHVYTGSAINPSGYQLVIKGANGTETELVKDRDYSVSVTKNTNAGVASISFTGINGYTGVLKKSFTITRASMSDSERISADQIEAVEYQKNGVKPAVTVRDNDKVLVDGVDYTVRYINNKAVHDGVSEVKRPTAIIAGKGNYQGTLSIGFAIKGSSLKNTTMTATDIVASNRANTCRPAVKLVDRDGGVLRAGVDYETVIKYTYVNNTTVERLVNKKKESKVLEAGTEVDKADIIPAGTQIKAVVQGKGFYVDDQETYFRYVATNIASAKVVIPNKIYTRNEIILGEDDIQISVTVNKKMETLTYGEDYKIAGYKNNINKGTAKVIIQGLKNYGGTKEVSFKIVSKTLNHTIRLHNNDGSGKDIVKAISIPSGTMLPVNTFKVTGKKFIGWNTRADGSGTAYSDREAIVRSYLSILIFGDTMDLYAQWE